MRQLFPIIVIGLLLTGCATTPQRPQSLADCGSRYIPAPAPILAFDPPVASPTPVLDRDLRQAAAVNGFAQSSDEVYDVQTDDDQLYFNGDSTYERRVISDRIGLTTH